jgi:SCAMP family
VACNFTILEHIVSFQASQRILLLRQPLSTLIPSTTLSRTKILLTSHLKIHTNSLLHESPTLNVGSETWRVENASYSKKLKRSENMAVTTGLLVSIFRSSSGSQKPSCLFLPVLLVVFPLIYHDISEEIPEASRLLIRRLYLLWLILAGTLIVNMVACIFVLTSGGSDGVKDLIISIMCVSPWADDFLVNSRHFALLDSIAPLISILSFLLWYR